MVVVVVVVCFVFCIICCSLLFDSDMLSSENSGKRLTNSFQSKPFILM